LAAGNKDLRDTPGVEDLGYCVFTERTIRTMAGKPLAPRTN
jgi:hypothetical protein